MIKRFVNKIPRFLRNWYSFSILFFIVWISFIDRNDLISQYRYRCQLHQLNIEKKYYADEIEKNRRDLKELMSSAANLEKYAREKYLMKKDDEDVFVFVSERKQEVTKVN